MSAFSSPADLCVDIDIWNIHCCILQQIVDSRALIGPRSLFELEVPFPWYSTDIIWSEETV